MQNTNLAFKICHFLKFEKTIYLSVRWSKKCETHSVLQWSVPADERCYGGNYSIAVSHLSSPKAAIIHKLGVRPDRENTHPEVHSRGLKVSDNRFFFFNYCLPKS